MVCKILKIPPGEVSELHIAYLLSCQETEPGLFLQHRSNGIALGLRSKVVLKKVFTSAICDMAALWIGILESGVMTNTNTIFNLDLSYA